MAVVSSTPVPLILAALLLSWTASRTDGRGLLATQDEVEEQARLAVPSLKNIADDMTDRISSYGSSSFSSSSLLKSLGFSSGGGGGYGDEGCCGYDFDTFIIGFVLVAATYLLFFLLNATVTSGRRRREIGVEDDKSLQGITKPRHQLLILLTQSPAKLPSPGTNESSSLLSCFFFMIYP